MSRTVVSPRTVRSSDAEISGDVVGVCMHPSCRVVKGFRPVAELHFFTGTMDSGKSTLALQTNHNHAARGRVGRIFTTHDRAGEAILSSRLGLTHDAIEVERDFDFWRYVVDSLTAGGRIDYLLCHEAQFSTTDQTEQL